MTPDDETLWCSHQRNVREAREKALRVCGFCGTSITPLDAQVWVCGRLVHVSCGWKEASGGRKGPIVFIDDDPSQEFMDD